MVYLTLFYVQWHECVRSSWNWIYSHLCAAAMWVLGMELTSSGRATKLFNGVLQIENKKTRQKQTDSLIFKSEFQDSQDYYMKLPEFKSAISQFQQECLQRSQEKKKPTNQVEWSARVKGLLHYLPTLAVFWISYLVSLSTHIEFNTCERQTEGNNQEKEKPWGVGQNRDLEWERERERERERESAFTSVLWENHLSLIYKSHCPPF